MRSVVVGAAIVRARAVLAARRTRPDDVAGRWELPGGKVDAGESPEVALAREIREELGCEVAVETWLAGEQAIGTAHLLRAAVCRLVDGEPTAGSDHDAVRWLQAEELDEVDWLEPDRPFLPQVRAVLLGSDA